MRDGNSASCCHLVQIWQHGKLARARTVPLFVPVAVGIRPARRPVPSLARGMAAAG